jgi:hypothetical protein
MAPSRPPPPASSPKHAISSAVCEPPSLESLARPARETLSPPPRLTRRICRSIWHLHRRVTMLSITQSPHIPAPDRTPADSIHGQREKVRDMRERRCIERKRGPYSWRSSPAPNQQAHHPFGPAGKFCLLLFRPAELRPVLRLLRRPALLCLPSGQPLPPLRPLLLLHRIQPRRRRLRPWANKRARKERWRRIGGFFHHGCGTPMPRVFTLPPRVHENEIPRMKELPHLTCGPTLRRTQSSWSFMLTANVNKNEVNPTDAVICGREVRNCFTHPTDERDAARADTVRRRVV